MKKIASSRMIIVIFLTCLYNGPNVVCPDPPESPEDLLVHVQHAQNWRWMWFSEFGRVHNRLHVSAMWGVDSGLGVVDRLRMVSPMMGCAYGVKFNWFLLLTFVTMEECHTMQWRRTAFGADCADRLGRAIGHGGVVVRKLKTALQYVDSVIGDDVEDNPFYNQLVPLGFFLAEIAPLANDSFHGYPYVASGEHVAQTVNDLAVRSRQFLLSTCRPDYEFFDLAATRNAHRRHPDLIYQFYVGRLHYYMDYIENHLAQLQLPRN